MKRLFQVLCSLSLFISAMIGRPSRKMNQRIDSGVDYQQNFPRYEDQRMNYHQNPPMNSYPKPQYGLKQSNNLKNRQFSNEPEFQRNQQRGGFRQRKTRQSKEQNVNNRADRQQQFDQIPNAQEKSKRQRKAYLNTTFSDYQPPTGTEFNPNPDEIDQFTQQAITERAGPVDFYPHWDFFPRWYNWQGFNSWFQNLWNSNRFTHEYRYDLIDTNFFLGQPETVGNPIFSDQESVDFQNYEQHFAHLQKILGDERTDQEFVIQYSQERAAHERMLRFRTMRDVVYQSILQMENLIYIEQDNIIRTARIRAERAENSTMENITEALTSLTNIPFYAKAPARLDIFVS